MQASEAIGIRGMLGPCQPHLALGLSQSPLELMMLMVTLADLRATL
jgi:hypothetical protein